MIAVKKMHSLGALLSAWTYYEKIVATFAQKVDLDQRDNAFSLLTNDLARGTVNRIGIEIPDALRQRLDQARNTKNLVAHGRIEPTKWQVNEMIAVMEDINKLLSELYTEKVGLGVRERKQLLMDRETARERQLMQLRRERLAAAQRAEAEFGAVEAAQSRMLARADPNTSNIDDVQ